MRRCMFLDLCGYSLRSTACTRYPFSDLPLNAASGGRLPSLTRPPLAARPATPVIRTTAADAAHALPAGHCLLSSDAHMYADGRGGHSLAAAFFPAAQPLSFPSHSTTIPRATWHAVDHSPPVSVCVWCGGGVRLVDSIRCGAFRALQLCL